MKICAHIIILHGWLNLVFQNPFTHLETKSSTIKHNTCTYACNYIHVQIVLTIAMAFIVEAFEFKICYKNNTLKIGEYVRRFT